MATIVASATGGNWTAGTCWVGGVAPTAADDAQIPATAGNITINSGAVCRSADFSTYTGTVTHTAAVTWTIGDATAGVSNIALKLVAGMTYTLGNATTSAISFVSTSATQQTIDWGGKTPGNVTHGTAGSWQYVSGYTAPATTLSLNAGILNTNGQTLSINVFSSSNSTARTLTMGASNITVSGGGTAWNIATATNMTITANTATITMTGASSTFAGGGLTYGGTVNMTGSGTQALSGNNTFGNFNRTGTATLMDGLSVVSTFQTVTGLLTLAGNSVINRLFVVSSALNTQRIFTVNGSLSLANVDFMDIGGNGSVGTFTGTSLGDTGGNTGITFDTPVSQTWSGTSSGNWSTNAWTSRVPLPQDNVVINAAFSGGQTVTADMPRLGASINWTGTTGAPTWAIGQNPNYIFGSLTMASGIIVSGSANIRFAGRGSFTIISAGVSFPTPIQIYAPGGTYTLQDNFVTAGTLDYNYGGLNLNNFSLTSSILTSNVTNPRALTFGFGTWILTSTATATVWLINASGLTLSAASGTIVISTASINTRQFSGGGLTYGTLTYTVSGSTGRFDIINTSNTFSTINFSDISNARIFGLGSGTTQTVTTAFNVSGTAGKLISITSASTHTLALPATSIDYVNITNSTATGGPAYAGANSVDNGGNTGWIFTAPPPTIVSSGGGNSRTTSLGLRSLAHL